MKKVGKVRFFCSQPKDRTKTCPSLLNQMNHGNNVAASRAAAVCHMNTVEFGVSIFVLCLLLISSSVITFIYLKEFKLSKKVSDVNHMMFSQHRPSGGSEVT